MTVFPKSLSLFLIKSCRTFATQETIVKVPKNIYSLEGRYATALFTAGFKSGGNAALEAVQKDLNSLSNYITKTPSAQRFLEDPTINPNEKKVIATSFGNKMGFSKSNPLVSNLLVLLAENGRMGMLPLVISAYMDILKAHRKEIDVEIITATDPTADFMKNLKEKLIKQFIPSDQVPIITSKVDPTILGGLLVHIADKTIDMSVLTKINMINKELSRAI